MAGTRFKKQCEAKGYCCPWAFLKAHRGPTDPVKPGKWSVVMVAQKLLVSTRCVKVNRLKLRSGKLVCEGNEYCMKRIAEEAEAKRVEQDKEKKA